MDYYDNAIVEFLGDKANIRLALEIAERIEEVKKTLDRTFWERVEQKILQKLIPSKGWRLCLHRDRTGQDIDIICGLTLFPENPSKLYLYPCIANLDLYYGIAWSQEMRRPYPLPEATKLYDALQDKGYQADNWWIGYKTAGGGVKLKTNQMYVRIATDDHLEEELASALVELFEHMRTMIEDVNTAIALAISQGTLTM
jgi:uncharacterized protein (UPF0297 family)